MGAVSTLIVSAAWGFLPISVREFAVSWKRRGVLDLPFLIDLPLRRIITSRLPCLGTPSRISLTRSHLCQAVSEAL